MNPLTVLHFGGNGHSAIRLDRAREALGRLCPTLTLVDLPYSGFEGRLGRTTFEAFLDDLAAIVRTVPVPPAAAYASGIGALIALGLRARGELAGVPLIFQGPVLWGLEDRWFPRVFRRFPPLRGLLRSAFGRSRFQARFARKQFVRRHDPEFLEGFFRGYRDCSSFGDFFDWLTPAWLRTLETVFHDHPARLGLIEVWVGGLDHVVGLAEVRRTERTLGVSWPVVEFATWGHYPMIDVPEEWAHALCRTLAPA